MSLKESDSTESEPIYDAKATAHFYPVIIVGGGPAGCATALSLIRCNPDSKFLLLDDSDPEVFKIGESLPPSAKPTLGYLSSALLSRLQEDTSVGNHGLCTGNASAWLSEHIEETYPIMNPYGMGWHLDRAHFDETLRDAVRDACSPPAHVGDSGSGAANSRKLERGRFTGVRRISGGWEVNVDGIEESSIQKTFRAIWLVDATGRKASLAHKLGANTTKLDSLLSFYALFSSNADHSPHHAPDRDRRTLIEAASSGWWYTAQLPHALRLVAYHTDASDPSARQARTLDGFNELLHAHTTHVAQALQDSAYEPLVLPGRQAQFPRCTAANSSFLEPCGAVQTYNDSEIGQRCSPGWCAVGDAAMAFDPLSSQGMITAIEMGKYVGAILGRHLSGSIKDPESNPDVIDCIARMYEKVRMKYQKARRYYYGQVTRFEGEFWTRQRDVSINQNI
ncbi:putative FAD-dependent oxidoreductase LodB [Grifola frondosa]|uniref:Putative FAD-dependent oxidoreductase LodB n=1 Tax=Grifola frondosa TaxID=5627 RepID=A0A1C7MR84_GRIFR|nr:putative FAD-dependent oxidoreductase LodB [Grifola frondosa]